jgi:hypothetical protein
VDSIIARPTNRVRVMVAAASGCCASELNAVATDRPSPSAGPMHPTEIVRPAVMIEAIAMSVTLSIVCPLSRPWVTSRLILSSCGGDINRGQNTEDIGLYHASEQTERTHDNREDKWRNGQQNGEDHRPAHHVAK